MTTAREWLVCGYDVRVLAECRGGPADGRLMGLSQGGLLTQVQAIRGYGHCLTGQGYRLHCFEYHYQGCPVVELDYQWFWDAGLLDDLEPVTLAQVGGYQGA